MQRGREAAGGERGRVHALDRRVERLGDRQSGGGVRREGGRFSSAAGEPVGEHGVRAEPVGDVAFGQRGERAEGARCPAGAAGRRARRVVGARAGPAPDGEGREELRAAAGLDEQPAAGGEGRGEQAVGDPDLALDAGTGRPGRPAARRRPPRRRSTRRDLAGTATSPAAPPRRRRRAPRPRRRRPRTAGRHGPGRRRTRQLGAPALGVARRMPLRTPSARPRRSRRRPGCREHRRRQPTGSPAAAAAARPASPGTTRRACAGSMPAAQTARWNLARGARRRLPAHHQPGRAELSPSEVDGATGAAASAGTQPSQPVRPRPTWTRRGDRGSPAPGSGCAKGLVWTVRARR